MAVWEIPQNQIIDYSANGDDVDSFSQKVKFCIENIFECLQHLHANGAQAGLDGAATPYEIRINTADGHIYIRNGDNTDWIALGEVAEHFGITPEEIQAVRNGGNIGRLTMGNEAALPATGNMTFDLYFAQDTSRVFIWTGSTWRIFLSLNFADTLNYQRYCLARSELTSVGGAAGAGKILQLDPVTGKGNIDITGSPERLLGYLIDVQDLRDGHVLAFNAERQKFMNLPNYELRRADTTYMGGVANADKLLKVAPDGKIHADITGSAEAIGSVPVELNNVADGQILRYHRSTNSFQNEDQSAVGSGRSLILRDGNRVLCEYNGSQTVDIDIQGTLNGTMLSNEVEHLMRLTENLYLALDAADLNPGGYDGLSGETFYGTVTDIDTTTVKVLSVVRGDDSIDVDSVEGLVEGSHYILSDGTRSEDVQIRNIIQTSSTNRVVCYSAITNTFTGNSIKLSRTTGTIGTGEVSGDGVYCTANLIPFVNEATGETTEISRAHLVVKHQNVADAEITAEIALRDGVKFVKGEVIGIGTGRQQTVSLEHTSNVTTYKFALYFDGVAQANGFEFSPTTGQVTFIAPNGAIVSADYFYDWAPETFVAMTKTGTYPDRRDQTCATTQFSYDGAAGTVATIRLKLSRGTGTATNEIISTGTGSARGFKLAHQAISGTVSISPAPTSWRLDSAQNTVIVTAPAGNAIRISYRWKGKPFSVQSFACTFNE